MDPIFVIALVVVAVGACFGIFLWMRNRPPKEEPVYYHQCANCKRRLRYRGRQAGHRGACPRCRNEFLFPPIPAKTP
jgi:hypothetical protein